MTNNIVFHFDHDPQALNIAFSNIKNYLAYFTEDKPQVALVVNGPGVKLLLNDGEFAEKIHEVSQLGAEIKVCRNALNAFSLSPEQLCPECVVIPAGVVELVELQKQGYAYVKP